MAKQQPSQKQQQKAKEKKKAVVDQKKAKQESKNVKKQEDDDKQKEAQAKAQAKEKAKELKLEKKLKAKLEKESAKKKKAEAKASKKNSDKKNSDKKTDVASKNKDFINKSDDDDDEEQQEVKSKISKKDLSNAFVMTIIILIASVSLFNVIVSDIEYKNSNGYVKIDEFITTVGNGKNAIQIGVAVGGVNKDINKLDTGSIKECISEALLNIDLDTINQLGGYEELKEHLLSTLQLEFGSEIQSISIHSLFTQYVY